MRSVPANEDSPDVGLERLVGRAFSGARLGVLLREPADSVVKVWWTPVEQVGAADGRRLRNNVLSETRCLSGRITGVETGSLVPSPEDVALRFERTGRDAGPRSAEDYLIIPRDGIPDFESRLQ